MVNWTLSIIDGFYRDIHVELRSTIPFADEAEDYQLPRAQILQRCNAATEASSVSLSLPLVADKPCRK